MVLFESRKFCERIKTRRNLFESSPGGLWVFFYPNNVYVYVAERYTLLTAGLLSQISWIPNEIQNREIQNWSP